LRDIVVWDKATPAEREAEATAALRSTPFNLVHMETFSCGGQVHEIAIALHGQSGTEFSLIPAGSVAVRDRDLSAAEPSAAGPYSIAIEHPFLIARTTCTQQTYERITGTNPSWFRGPTLPVETVSWDDAIAFCSNLELSLPTEAQWEYACRAGTTSKWFFGNDVTVSDLYLWHEMNYAGTTHPVAQKLPNAFGLYDMNGNVWQWCSDPIPNVASGYQGVASDLRPHRGGGGEAEAAHSPPTWVVFVYRGHTVVSVEISTNDHPPIDGGPAARPESLLTRDQARDLALSPELYFFP